MFRQFRATTFRMKESVRTMLSEELMLPKPSGIGICVISSYKSDAPKNITADNEDALKENIFWSPWYKSFFDRKSASQTYGESNYIDFHEESHSDYQVLVSQKDQEIGSLKTQLKIRDDDLAFVRCRCQIEVFEFDYGQEADKFIDKATLPKSLSYVERTRRIRAMKIAWILRNRRDEWRVNDLYVLIEKSVYFQGDIDMFAESIAIGYDDLSRIIKRRILIPGTGQLTYKYTTTNERANRAIETFMDLFEIKDVVTVQKS